MRLFYLFIPLFLSCKINPPFHSIQASQYDSLRKYSYLLVGLPGRDTKPSGLRDVSSGFFIRDTKNRLFLVSAYHALTGCAILIGEFRDTRDDTLQVWYIDTLGHYKSEQFMLTAYKNKPCHTLIPDVDTMDVTDHFKDGRIFSVERMMPDNLPRNIIAAGDNVICYGYPNVKIPPKTGDTPVSPSDTISVVAPARKGPMKISSIYFVIRPALRSGFSGAPVFRIKAGEKAEFEGVQSSTNTRTTQSLIVRSIELGNLLQWK